MSTIVKQAGPIVRGRPAGQLCGSPAYKWCKDIAGIIRNMVLVTPHVKEFLPKIICNLGTCHHEMFTSLVLGLKFYRIWV